MIILAGSIDYQLQFSTAPVCYIKSRPLQNANNHFDSFFYIYFNPLMGLLILQSNGPLYSNMVISTLAVDG